MIYFSKKTPHTPTKPRWRRLASRNLCAKVLNKKQKQQQPEQLNHRIESKHSRRKEEARKFIDKNSAIVKLVAESVFRGKEKRVCQQRSHSSSNYHHEPILDPTIAASVFGELSSGRFLCNSIVLVTLLSFNSGEESQKY